MNVNSPEDEEVLFAERSTPSRVQTKLLVFKVVLVVGITRSQELPDERKFRSLPSERTVHHTENLSVSFDKFYDLFSTDKEGASLYFITVNKA